MAQARRFLVVIATAAAACAPPTDRLVRVAAEATPLVASAAPGAPLVATLHAGELLELGGARPALSWKGELQGKPAEASGPVVEARRAPGDEPALAWKGALGDEVSAPTTSYLCHRMKRAGHCNEQLRRIATADGGTFAYLPCSGSACPLALSHGRKLSLLNLDGVREARLATVAGQQVLLVDTLRVHDDKFTEQELHVLRLDGGLRKGLKVPLRLSDTRAVRQHLIDGELTVDENELRYVGRDRYYDAEHGVDISSQPIRQTYRLAPAAR